MGDQVKETRVPVRGAAAAWLLPGLLLLGAVPATPASAIPITFEAELSGAAEAPPNASPGDGDVIVIYDGDAHTLRIEVTFDDLLGNVTAAHIHCCTADPDAGTVGVASETPSFTGFPAGVTSGTYTNTFDLTDPASFNLAFVSAHGNSLTVSEAALAEGLAAGRAYFNIHTSVFPGGEIRGFLHQVPEPGVLALTGLGLVAFLASRSRTRRERSGAGFRCRESAGARASTRS